MISPEVECFVLSKSSDCAFSDAPVGLCSSKSLQTNLRFCLTHFITAEKEDFLVHLTFGIYILQADFCLLQISSRFVKIVLTDEGSIDLLFKKKKKARALSVNYY